MSLNNTEIRYYDGNVLRLPAEKRTAYHQQVDRLISELSKKLKDQNKITITKVVKAGSFAKFTIHRIFSGLTQDGEDRKSTRLNSSHWE